MADTDGSSLRRAAFAACLLTLLASQARAQYTAPPGIAAKPAAPDIFTRTSFHMFASKLSIDDPKFDWDAHFGGDLDVIDYVRGRLVLIADYEAIIGSEYRGIDPNQGNYTLEPSLSWRIGEGEVALTYHHVSRHLGDRAKTFAIDWNILGGRYLRRVAIGGATADIAVGGGTFVEHSHVDYRWTANGDMLIRRPVNHRVGAFVRATGETFGVDHDVFQRDRQSGGKLEGGVNIAGTGGALELFGGFESRVDADPLVNGSRHWALVGFRFLSK